MSMSFAASSGVFCGSLQDMRFICLDRFAPAESSGLNASKAAEAVAAAVTAVFFKKMFSFRSLLVMCICLQPQV